MNEYDKILNKLDTFDFCNWLHNRDHAALELSYHMDFVKTVLRSDKVSNFQKGCFWDYLDFYRNIDLVREGLYYIDWSSILCMTRTTPQFEKAIEEFLPYFELTDWLNLEGKLWNMSFEFIMKYSDHWTYSRSSSPVRRLWSGATRTNTPFTKEQEKWIRKMWKRK